MGTAYNANIVTDGLVLCLDAANPRSYPGSGTTWSDLSGNGNNGTLINGPTFSNENGGLFVFDGSNDNISLSKTMSQMNVLDTSFTICCFCNRSSLSNFYTGYLGFEGPSVSILSSTNVFLDVRTVFNTRYIIPIASPFPSDVWAHFCFTINNNTAKTYFNGNLFSTRTLDGNIQTVQNRALSFGKGYGYYSYLGSMAQLSMYDIVLTDQQIFQNYKATRGRYGI